MEEQRHLPPCWILSFNAGHSLRRSTSVPQPKLGNVNSARSRLDSDGPTMLCESVSSELCSWDLRGGRLTALVLSVTETELNLN